jgi:hypothetical protein
MSNITGLFSKVGGWISGLLGSTGFGSGILMASQTLFAGGKYSLIGTLGEMFTNSAAITQAGSWGSMIGFALTKGLLAAVTAAFTIDAIVDGADKGLSTGAYNEGLMEAGGKEEDKKSNAGNVLGTTLKGAAGGAATGALIGGPVGAAIGAAIGGIAGLLTSALAPAFADVEIAARNANNEMQRLEYYEGVVQGASTKVTEFDGLLQLSNQAIQAQTDKVYALGAEYGVSTATLDTLIASMKEGNFTSEMTVGLNSELVGALTQLDWHYANNKEVTDKLTEAKRKLQKAEMDLAIAEDVAAGNFEMAAARIEVALASELYETDEATKKMTQVIKEASAEQAADILQDLSPDMRKNFNSYYDITKGNIDELTELYFGYKEDERDAFLQNLTPEIAQQMQDRVNAIKREVENAPWYMRLMDIGNDGKILGMSYVDVPGYATGTNYVPNDGLAYLHKGEAVIPAKYNEGMGTQGKAYQQNTAASQELLHAITSLEATLNRGINVQGQFVQRGSDLVATVEKASNRMSNNILNNKVYAR